MFPMIHNCASGTTFDTVCTQLVHQQNLFWIWLCQRRDHAGTATPFSQKPFNRSTSCFAKRYNSVSFVPARATIPQQKIEITSPIQSSNLIRLKELKFDSSRNNFRETKYVCPCTIKKSRVYFEYNFLNPLSSVEKRHCYYEKHNSCFA